MDANIQKDGELSLPQAFLLLATNDMDGGTEVPSAVLRAGVAGAILAELDLLGAIELQGKHVVATGSTPQTDFQHQLEIIRDRPGLHTPKKCVSMLESRAELHRIYEGMAALGIVDHVGERHLGLFRTTRYPEKDHAPEAALLKRIEAALSGGSSDPRTTALIALLHSAEMLGRIFPSADQSQVREKANDYWPSRAVAGELRMIRLAEAEAAT
ncbi:GPP34 family phosphoprotein [Pseudarthrobacter sp. SSS035]|uniref:GOLPH3/VPS74 family protein n=1 Tax=Pseudarthrobacter sp. SSS035 TaxID=2931399 RepID=UPI002010881A|nr:GPP34 family phosphoprotein [Pseudarthrobacter sp. SSS035]